MTPRAEVLKLLAKTDFDLAVVGGGITGAGIARDAALRGLRVALVEKGDLAHGTSSASSKLIHGGLRYLEQLQLGLVREGTRERALLMKNAPHLARPLPFLLPIYETSRAGPLKIAAGMWLYDALALFRNYRRHRMLHPREVRRSEPMLRTTGLRAGTLYYDCMTDDARLVVETAVDARSRGAVIATHLEVTAFRRDELGRVSGVIARDVLDRPERGKQAAQVEVRARVTIAATGPWTDELLKLVPGQAPLLRPTKGVHLVLPRERLTLEHAVVLTAVRDARVLFAIPWGPRSIVGTTDTDDASSPDACEATAADVDYLLETANHYFPALRATEDDVVATWAGLRPLMAAQAEHASDVSREHEILDVVPGLVTIAGGKLTTYRLMAEQAVDRIVRKIGVRSLIAARCTTEETPLIGARDPEALADLGRVSERLVRQHGLPADVADHMVFAYGLRASAVLDEGTKAGVAPERLVAGLPYIWSEVAFAVKEDFAERVDDVLRRRTLVFLKDREQGLGVVEAVAALMARLLSWDAERQASEVARYRGLVARSRAFRRAEAQPTPAAAPASLSSSS